MAGRRPPASPRTPGQLPLRGDAAAGACGLAADARGLLPWHGGHGGHVPHHLDVPRIQCADGGCFLRRYPSHEPKLPQPEGIARRLHYADCPLRSHLRHLPSLPPGAGAALFQHGGFARPAAAGPVAAHRGRAAGRSGCGDRQPRARGGRLQAHPASRHHRAAQGAGTCAACVQEDRHRNCPRLRGSHRRLPASRCCRYVQRADRVMQPISLSRLRARHRYGEAFCRRPLQRVCLRGRRLRPADCGKHCARHSLLDRQLRCHGGSGARRRMHDRRRAGHAPAQRCDGPHDARRCPASAPAGRDCRAQAAHMVRLCG